MRVLVPLRHCRHVVSRRCALSFTLIALAACGDPTGVNRTSPRIVFVREPNYDTLFVSDLHNGAAAQPMVAPLVSSLFRFSPSGDRLATTRAGALIVMNADGSDPHQIASNAGQLTWSPDGSRIVYVRVLPRELHIVGADGSNDNVVAGVTPGGWLGLAWSPAGDRIAFEGERPLAGGGMTRGVFIVKLDGTDLRDLDASLPGPEARASGEPTWSPDGRYLAFHRFLKLPNVVETKLWVMALETGQAWRITSGDGEDVRPDWSPSGDQLVFLRFHGSSSDVFVVRPDGAGLRQLTDTPEREESPSYWARP